MSQGPEIQSQAQCLGYQIFCSAVKMFSGYMGCRRQCLRKGADGKHPQIWSNLAPSSSFSVPLWPFPSSWYLPDDKISLSYHLWGWTVSQDWVRCLQQS